LHAFLTLKALQKRLLARMRSFGMTTVLSAFAGHVPKALIDKYPEAQYIRSSEWGHMPDSYGGVYMLAPEDPLFTEIGNRFIAKQAEEWGTMLSWFQNLLLEDAIGSHDCWGCVTSSVW
jgi:hypothetical protein